MSKPCSKEDCNNPRFSKGYCKWHQYLRTDKKKPKRYISPVTKKKLDLLAIYRVVRDKYMGNNKICEVDGCCKKANDLHHKAGRQYWLLIAVDYFMAVCRDCHEKFDTSPEWAKKEGYTINLSTDKVREITNKLKDKYSHDA